METKLIRKSIDMNSEIEHWDEVVTSEIEIREDTVLVGKLALPIKSIKGIGRSPSGIQLIFKGKARERRILLINQSEDVIAQLRKVVLIELLNINLSVFNTFCTVTDSVLYTFLYHSRDNVLMVFKSKDLKTPIYYVKSPIGMLPYGIESPANTNMTLLHYCKDGVIRNIELTQRGYERKLIRSICVIMNKAIRGE